MVRDRVEAAYAYKWLFDGIVLTILKIKYYRTEKSGNNTYVSNDVEDGMRFAIVDYSIDNCFVVKAF